MGLGWFRLASLGQRRVCKRERESARARERERDPSSGAEDAWAEAEAERPSLPVLPPNLFPAPRPPGQAAAAAAGAAEK